MLDLFFSSRNKASACGMWSIDYVVALIIVVAMVIIGLILSRNMSKAKVKKTLLIFAICSISTEIIKMIFTGFRYGINEVEPIPLYFCSLFMYSLVFTQIKNEYLNIAGLSFLSFGGIIGAILFFIYPSACIPNYPIYHFMCIRTMLYHGSMIYVGLLILITKYYVPNENNFVNYLMTLLLVCVLAYSYNLIFNTDMMYIMEPLDFSISNFVYELSPILYPFIVMLIEIFVPYWTSYLIYRLTLKILKK